MEGKLKLSHKVKLFIFISIEMIAIITIFLLILFAGKKRYTVTFDLNGGELLGGDLIQTVTRGQNATAPSVTKDGCYLLKWSEPYTKVTKNVYTVAIWEYETTAGIEYEVVENSNYCLISGCYKELSGSVYIGAYYNGLKVLGIKENAFEDCNKITSIHLLDGMLSIGNNAFKNCTSLKKINIPKTVETIGGGAFENCTNLETMTIPASIQNIREGAFENCANLETLVITESKSNITISPNAFKNCAKLSSITFEEIIEEAPEVDEEDENDAAQEEQIIEEKTNKVIIENSAFENCVSLEILNLSNRVISIGESAFSGCVNLETVIFGNELAKIDSNAFSGCEKITEVTLPVSLVEMGNAVFGHDLTINVFFTESETPSGFYENWCTINSIIVYDYQSVLDNLQPDDSQEEIE